MAMVLPILSVQAAICKYTDKQGNVHYTNVAPEVSWRRDYCMESVRIGETKSAEVWLSAIRPRPHEPDGKYRVEFSLVHRAIQYPKSKTSDGSVGYRREVVTVLIDCPSSTVREQTRERYADKDPLSPPISTIRSASGVLSAPLSGSPQESVLRRVCSGQE